MENSENSNISKIISKLNPKGFTVAKQMDELRYQNERIADALNNTDTNCLCI